MDKYRLADNKMFQVDGREFLLLSQENAIFEMDRETRAFLKHFSPAEELSREEFAARPNGSLAANKEIVDSLIDRQVVIKAGEVSWPSRNTEQIRFHIQTLVLHVTDSCNLGCLYCYHRQEDRETAVMHPMSPELARKAVDFLFDHAGNHEELTLVFFGGEPLLNFEVIARTVDYALEKNKAAKTVEKVNFAITTNGSLLSDSVIEFLNEKSIGVTVSIDGFQAVHDRYRVFPDGRPTYKAILPKIKKYLESNRPKPVVARVTVAEKPPDLLQVLEHLLGLGFSEVGFAPVTSADNTMQLDREGMDQLLEQFKTMAGKFLEYARKGDFLGFTNLVDLLVIFHQGETKNYPCGAGLGLFAVNPSGRLYLCQRLVGDDRFRMGDIHSGFDRSKLETFRDQAEISEKKICRVCWARSICAGGCYHEALTRKGSLVSPNSHYCHWIRSWLETGLEIYGRMALEIPEYLDKLLWLRGRMPIHNHILSSNV